MDKGEHRAEIAKLVTTRKAQGKPAWERTIDLRGIFHADKPITEIRDVVVEKIKSSGWLELHADDEDFLLLIEELEECENELDFNYLWNEVYDYADYDRVWIATM